MNKVHQESLGTFTSFDVVGCGINFYTKEVFFTYNGILQRNKKRLVKANPLKNVEIVKYYPTVGVQGIGCSFTMNFGKEEFMFDIAEMFDQAKLEIVQ